MTPEALRAMRDKAMDRAEHFSKQTTLMTGKPEFWFFFALTEHFLSLCEVLTAGAQALDKEKESS